MQCTLPYITPEPQFRSIAAFTKCVRRSGFLTRGVQRADSNAIASTSSQATITSEATAPAVILAFSFKLVGRSMSDDIGGRWPNASTRLPS